MLLSFQDRYNINSEVFEPPEILPLFEAHKATQTSLPNTRETSDVRS